MCYFLVGIETKVFLSSGFPWRTVIIPSMVSLFVSLRFHLVMNVSTFNMLRCRLCSMLLFLWSRSSNSTTSFHFCQSYLRIRSHSLTVFRNSQCALTLSYILSFWRVLQSLHSVRSSRCHLLLKIDGNRTLSVFAFLASLLVMDQMIV